MSTIPGEVQAEGKVQTLLRQLQLRFGIVPPEVVERIRATRQVEEVDRWLDAVVTAGSLDEFRQQAGL